MIGVCLAFFMFFAVCCGTLLDTMISVVAINVFYPNAARTSLVDGRIRSPDSL